LCVAPEPMMVSKAGCVILGAHGGQRCGSSHWQIGQHE
jgi:hypothetical protein